MSTFVCSFQCVLRALRNDLDLIHVVVDILYRKQGFWWKICLGMMHGDLMYDKLIYHHRELSSPYYSCDIHVVNVMFR